jgi:hypothetical protein
MLQLFLQVVKQFSNQKISFTACNSSFTGPVKLIAIPPFLKLT